MIKHNRLLIQTVGQVSETLDPKNLIMQLSSIFIRHPPWMDAVVFQNHAPD